MIAQIEIWNFQSHKHTLIDLDKGINVFVGGTDKGKTVIIRALRWVFDNKPNGEAYRSTWGGDTKVKITFSDGLVLCRVRTNTENYYTLNNDKKFKAMGQGVPPEIEQLLNIGQSNVQLQMDGPFLIGKTAGEVANYFNRIAGISVIDKSIAKAKKEINRVKQSIVHKEEDLEEKQEQHKQYANLTEIESKVNQLDALEKKKTKLQQGIAQLKDYNIRLRIINQNIEKKQQLTLLEQTVKQTLEKRQQKADLSANKNNLRTLTNRLCVIDEKLGDIDKIIDAGPLVKILLSKTQELGHLRADLGTLKGLVGQCTTVTQKGCITQENLQVLLDRLPDVCPVCNGTGKLK